MNYRTLLILVAVLILLNLGFFYFQNTNKTKSLPLYPPQLSSSQNNINLPVSPNDTRIKSLNLIYTFSGRLAKIEQVGSSYRLILDNNDKNLPEFLVDNSTLIFSGEKNLTQVNLSSIKTGASLLISMSYDLKTKTWKLNTITVAPEK